MLTQAAGQSVPSLQQFWSDRACVVVPAKSTHLSTFLLSPPPAARVYFFKERYTRIATQHLKVVMIHVHVPLHCTAWINGESWSLVETHKPVASHFSRSTLCFEGFSLLQCSQEKKSTPEDNSWQISVRRSQEHLAFFFSFFLVFLPLKVLLFWIVFQGCPVNLNVIQKRLSFRHWVGLRLHFHCLAGCRPSGSQH